VRRLTTIAVVLVALAACGSAAAESDLAFDRAPGRLPKTVVPLHYAIELEPDLDKLTLAGLEHVDIDVREPTARVVLNAAAMTIEASVGAQAASVALDEAAQTATLTFAQPLAAGRHRLRIAFTARIDRAARGLFYVDYPTDKGQRRMLATHLEPAHARRVFPSWDEPAFKATFALTVTVPRGFLAVSNMPPAREEPVTPTLKQVSFQPTPKMSSYLFVLAAGELERITATADGVTVGVVAAAGRRERGRYALDSAVALLRYFNDYFGIRYPLPKLDLIAVPGGGATAMENWGGIVAREGGLLVDPAADAATARRGIFALLAHEIAHQWFGNLVTMAWWDDLWLNEGFATWMEIKAADHFHPHWRTWLDSGADKQLAMNLDARRSARPLRRPVGNEREAMAAFDAVTYAKGQALIRMFEHDLGERAFRAGIRRYMAAHAYGSATTADLWRALEEAAGRPLAAMAAPFVERPGVPLVVAEAHCSGGEQRVRLRQERFVLRPAGEAAAETGGAAWQVPVTLGFPRAARPAESVLLDEPREVVAGRCGEPFKLNLGDVGYYRVEYDAASRAALAKSMALMGPADRANLLADGWALVEAGRAGAQSYFELVEEVAGDDSRAVWQPIIRTFSRLDWLARGRPERPALRAYARVRLRAAFDRLGWDTAGAAAGDGALARPRLIRVLGELEDAQVLAEAGRRFAAFLQNPATLPPALRDPVIHLAGLSADRATYDALLALARRANRAGEKRRFFTAAAGARDPALARATLALTLSEEVPAWLVGPIIGAVAGAGEQPELAWDFLRQNFPALAARQGPWFRNSFVASFMTHFSDAARAAELADFAAAHAAPGTAAIARSRETILIAAELKRRVLPDIADWLSRRGGARD
jgi:aminopeptidase N